MQTIDRKAIFMFCAAFALAGTSTRANAGVIIDVNVTDAFYGAFSGSIQQGATGAAAVLSWHSAGYYWAGDIALTDISGIINADIVTNHDDLYTLYAVGSGYATLGSLCVSGGTTACLVATADPQSLYSIVNAMNGGWGIFNGGDIVVTDSVPEPVSMTLVAVGILALAVRRRRRTFHESGPVSMIQGK